MSRLRCVGSLGAGGCPRLHDVSPLRSSSLPRKYFSADADTDGTPQMMGSSISRILTDEQRSLFSQVNQLASASRALARQLGNVPVKEDSLLADIARLQTQRRRLRQREASSVDAEQRLSINETIDEAAPLSLFTVVFAGEFNSGKSTLINALLGSELVDTGVLPTTDTITIIMANDGGADSDDENGVSSVVESGSIDLKEGGGGVPAHTQLNLLPTSKFPILSDLCLIDTPGTNAILSLQHTSSTLRILHDADLIVFVTSADRPFSESEKQLLKTSIKSYRKRVVLVINKMDVLERQKGEDHGDATKKRVEEYVVEHASDLLGARPVVIPLSARDALSVKLLYDSHQTSVNDQPLLWKRSNFGTLENYLSKSLTSSSKVRTKLLNPLGVSEGILTDCKSEVQRRQEELDVDIVTLRLLTSQTEAWQKEVQSEVIEKCLSNARDAIVWRSEAARRVLGELSFLEQWKIGTGMGRVTFDRAWERANRRGRSKPASSNDSLENELQSIVVECVEALASRAQSQGNASIEYLGKRPAVIKGRNDGMNRMIGTVTTPQFQQMKELQPSSTAIIRSCTSDLPSNSQCADQVYKSLRRSVLLSCALVGSGFVPAALSFVSALDVTTGMVACGTLAALGGTSLPLANRRIASTYEMECIRNASELEDSLKNLFQDAMERVQLELSESVAPYSRYVKTEGEWLKGLSEQMENGLANAHGLRSKINKACQ